MAFAPPKLPPLPLVRAVELVRYALAEGYRRLVPGRLALMEMLAAGWLSQAIHAAAALGLADALAAGPRSSGELAAAVHADEDALRRLLRLLISHGIFTQRRDGRYALTPAARALRGDSGVSLRDAALFFGSVPHRAQWSGLVDAVRSGKPVGWADTLSREETAEPEAAADDSALFRRLRTDSGGGDLFDRAMASIGSMTNEYLLEAYEFAEYDTIVDIGGGHGALLTDALLRSPRARGVLFDLPDVITTAAERFRTAGVDTRAEVCGGSFFDAVPTGGDLYLLAHVLHDWADDRALRLLRTVRAAVTPSARVLVVEIVLPQHTRPHPANYINLEMLINSGGRERTEDDYRRLLAAAGFAVTRVIPTVAPQSLIEARPV